MDRGREPVSPAGIPDGRGAGCRELLSLGCGEHLCYSGPAYCGTAHALRGAEGTSDAGIVRDALMARNVGRGSSAAAPTGGQTTDPSSGPRLVVDFTPADVPAIAVARDRLPRSERPEEVAGEANDVVGIDCIGRAS